MRFKKTDWIFVLVAGSVVGLLVVLSMTSRQAKPMAARPEHAGMTRETMRADCMSCHDPAREGATAPLSAQHPLVWKKEQVACTTCHEAPAARTASREHHPQEERETQ